MYTHIHRDTHAHKVARAHMLIPMVRNKANRQKITKKKAWRYLKEARRRKEREETES